jgi:uncharacterized protein (TIGR02391 family)
MQTDVYFSRKRLTMASTLPPFSPQQVEQVARIIGGTDDGLTGPEIGGMLGHLGFPDEGATQTKWKRLYNSLAHLQNKHNVGNHTVQLINAVMRPEGYVSRRDLFKSRQVDLNTVLAFAGYYVRDDGKVASTPKVATLDEAFAKASRMSEQLRARGVHDKILAFCRAELVQSNYFHAVFEAMKSLKTRINEMSGVDGDGGALVDDTFGLARGPIIAINALRNATDEGEQKGFANLLKGLFGMVRNPLAHNAKVEWEMPEQDALDILTTLSLVHRKLDKAVVRQP